MADRGGERTAWLAELDTLRRQAGLSFRDLSRATGRPASTLHNALTGRVFPRLDTVVAVVRACGADEAPWRARWVELTSPGGAARNAPGGAEQPRTGPGLPRLTPRELPHVARGFVGRAAELERVAALLDRDGDHGVVIVAVHGMPGVGKTALATRLAHEVGRRFPDGQIFLDLRGHRADADPMPAPEALAKVLRALDVAEPAIPADVDEQVRLYRSALGDRRLLIVLDDAIATDQVRPLVPGRAGCLVIVTSRHRLDGILAIDGAEALPLDVLSAHEARQMLRRILGDRRAADEDEAVAELAALCGCLPLALRVAAANLSTRPHRRIRDAVAELACDRIAALRAPTEEQVAISSAFTQSYGALPEPARTLFRRIGAAPDVELTAAAAAALLPAPADAAARGMEELAARCLVEERSHHRYGMHDLVRHYAADRARKEDSEADRTAALDRLLDWLREQVDAAARRLYPENLRLPAVSAGAPDAAFADKREALEWLDSELPNLVAVTTYASRHRPRPAVWLLADSLRGYFVLRLRIREWVMVASAGLRVAEQLKDCRAQGAMRHSLGLAHSRGGDNAAAQWHLSQALELHRSAGWPEGSANVLVCLGGAYFQQGLLDRAADTLEEAATIAGRHGLAVQETAALGDLGEVCRDLGMFHRARDHQRATAARCRALGMSRGEAIALANLWFVNAELGEFGTARECLEDAHRRFAALGSRDGEAYALVGLAAVDLGVGALDEAMERARRAVCDAEALNDVSLVVEALLARAEASRRLRQHAEAVADAERARSLAAEQGYRRGLVRACLELGATESARGRDSHAREHGERALRLSRDRGYRSAEAHALTLLAALDARCGRREQAAERARAALTAHRGTGHRAGAARAQLLLAQPEQRPNGHDPVGDDITHR